MVDHRPSILLIGNRERNADHMMIDVFAPQARAQEGKSTRDSIFEASTPAPLRRFS